MYVGGWGGGGGLVVEGEEEGGSRCGKVGCYVCVSSVYMSLPVYTAVGVRFAAVGYTCL